MLKKFYTTFTLIPFLFGGGLIPTFLIIRDLGLYNSFWALILPAGVSIWNALIAKTFFQSNISDELMDDYIFDLQIVQKYAQMTRDIIIKEILKGMKWKVTDRYCCIHNYIDLNNYPTVQSYR